MKIPVFTLLIFCLNLTAQNGFSEWDKNYKLLNPTKVIQNEVAYAEQTENNSSEAQYYVTSKKLRFIADFTGKERKISKEKMESMARVVSLKFGKKNFITYEIVDTEFEFICNKEKIWMPIQNAIKKDFKQEINTNTKVLLYTLFLNEHTQKNTLNNNFFISEFTNNWSEPEKQLWAKSFLNKKAPKLTVEEWISDEPIISTNKFLLIDFWATWCGPCKKAIPKLNKFQEEFKTDLVIIGISDESKTKIQNFAKPKIEYYSAIDTEKRLKNIYEVKGVPHCVLIDPKGIVRWEGFPLLENNELTTETIKNIIEKYKQ